MWWDTILWLVAIVLFVAVEAATTALVSVWFAIGAAAAIVSAVALGVMVPSFAKHRKEHQPPVTNGSPLTIGKQGVVLTAIEPGLPGRVRVDGLDWQAKAGVTLAPDTRIVVNDVDGAVLIVSPVTEKTTV